MSWKNNQKDFTKFIFVGFAIIIGIVFYVLLFRKPSLVTITVKVGEGSVYYYPWRKEGGSSPWFVDLLKPGMSELDGLGRKQAEIIDTFTFDTASNTKTVYLTIKLKAVYNRASDTYNYKGMGVLVGSTIKLNLNEVLIEGLITNVEGVPDNRQKTTIIVKAKLKDENSTYLETSGVDPYIADAVNIGDKMLDNHGNLMIEVIDKRTTEALRSSINSFGVTRTDSNPLRKDVDLTLKINVVEINNRHFMFDDIPILIGDEIPFNTKYYSVFPEVTEIIEAE